MEDPAKRRRTYLQKKGGAGFLLTLLVLACVPFAVIGLLSILEFTGGSLRGPQIPYVPWGIRGSLVLLILLSIGPLVAAMRMARRVNRTYTSLPYVPPVRQQIETLSATEVLVRSSNEPTATADELLRAAREGAETEAGELLRASESRTE
jgi:hypothetical protein